MKLRTSALLCIVLPVAPAASMPAGPPVPTVAKTTPAQQMIILYRDEYAHSVFKPCAPARAGEVVVCGNGRGGSADRIPLPEESGPRAWPRTATGDIPSGGGALALTGTTSCRGSDCGTASPVSLIAVATGAVQVVRAIVDPEGASDHADRQHPR